VSRRRDPQRPAGDYEVGYGRPPAASRFKPGQSGNPRGRPKGGQSIGQALQRALSDKVGLRTQNGTRRVMVQEAIVRRIVHDATNGDTKAQRLLFALQERHPESGALAPAPSDLLAEDQAILAGYLQRVQAASDAAPLDDEANAPHATQDAADGTS